MVVAPEESRQGLTFRSAVNLHEHRPLAGKFCWRLVQESGNHFSVKTLPMNQFRFGERIRLHGRFAEGPPLELAGVYVQRIAIGLPPRRLHRESKFATIPAPAQAADHSGG